MSDMNYDEVVMGRKSIRGYLDKPVPRSVIEDIVGLAMRSPSSMNTQPWHFHAITGEPLDRIKRGNTENILAGKPDSREFRKGKPFAGIHRRRQIEVAKQLFSEMQIARNDKDARQDWVLRGFRQFDAPVCVIVTYDRELSTSDDAPFDCGAATTALVNAACWTEHVRRGKAPQQTVDGLARAAASRWWEPTCPHAPLAASPASVRTSAPRTAGLVAWAGLRDQLPRHHAKPRRARARGHSRRPGDHEGGRDGLPGLGVPGQPRLQQPPGHGRCGAIRRLPRGDQSAVVTS